MEKRGKMQSLRKTLFVTKWDRKEMRRIMIIIIIISFNFITLKILG